MTHADLAQKIRALDGLTPAEKSALLDLLHHPKRYGLVWEEKPEAVEELLRASLPVLHEVPERRIFAGPPGPRAPGPPGPRAPGPPGPGPGLTQKNAAPPTEIAPPSASRPASPGTLPLDFGEQAAPPPPAPHHLLIEGDNLHALTALSYTHAGRVDVIYIDPPYNTGNRDFKYNDHFVDREDAYRHSKWLSFMAKRLRLARTLLADTGVIFISIDDNEQAQLKLLCDEVFGEENFIEIFSWVKTSTPPALSKKSRKTIEYVLCYEKERNSLKYQGELLDGGDAPLLNTGNSVRELLFSSDTVEFRIPDGNYPSGQYDRVFLLDDLKVSSGKADKDFRLQGEFKWTEKTFADEVKSGTTFLIKSEKFSVRFQRLESGGTKTPTNLLKESIYTPVIDKKIAEVDTNETASKSLEEILGAKKFDYPKPVSLIRFFLNFFPSKSSLVLDFFAGSGTTLHAVMALNAEDGGTRQCMLVTNNESNIAEEVCYERNRRVIAGYTKPNGETVPGLTNNHLHYYRTGFVGRERSLANKRALVRAATDLLCVKEACFEPYLLEGAGGDLRLFTNGTGGAFLVVYDDAALDEAVALVQRLAEGPDRPRRLSVYVFAPGPYPYTDDFEDVLTADFPLRVTLCALPEAIYRAWQHLLPPPGQPQPVDEEEIRPVLRDELTGTPEGGGA